MAILYELETIRLKCTVEFSWVHRHYYNCWLISITSNYAELSVMWWPMINTTESNLILFIHWALNFYEMFSKITLTWNEKKILSISHGLLNSWTDIFILPRPYWGHAFKIRTFWEANKIWKNLPHGLDVY